MTSFFYVVSISFYFIHCYAAIFLHGGFNCYNSLWCQYSVCLTRSRRGLMLFMNFLVHPYTCCSDRLASPYWTFIHRWISMGFTPSLLKKRMTQSCSSLAPAASGAAIFTLLLRRRVAFLHRTAACRPLFKLSVSLLSTYRQTSCVLNCYRTFKIFIGLSLVVARKLQEPYELL